MGVLPFLAPSFRARYDPAPDGTLQPGDGIPGPSPLMAILMPGIDAVVKILSPVAKLDRSGRSIQRWNYELPPMEITGMLVNAYHIQGAAPTSQFPYSLKAVGRVDANLIRRGGRGLVATDFQIVP